MSIKHLRGLVPVLAVAGLALVTGQVHASESVEGAGFLDMAKDAGFMEYILLLVSIAGMALFLQGLVVIRPHLMRPPHLSAELLQLVEEGNLEEALNISQADQSFLGVVATATLSKAEMGKEAMEGAMVDAGEVEANKFMHKIGVLNLIAAIAPMLGLTGTTIGMIQTFAVIAVKADAVTASDMAKGIAVALVCTFTGLMVAIPLLVGGYFLKARVTTVMHEISGDCNEMIRIVIHGPSGGTGGGEQEG